MSRKTWLLRSTVMACWAMVLAVGSARAQTTPAVAMAPADNTVLLRRLQELESEVKQVRSLRSQVNQLQTELTTLRQNQTAPPAPVANPGGGGNYGAVVDGEAVQPAGGGPGTSTNVPGGAYAPTEGKTGGPEDDDWPLKLRYKYNFGGGYTQASDADGEFSVSLQNQVTADGTFYDRQNIPTTEKGFNVPFQRIYLYGNITKNWEYQVSTQGFLGQFNLLDMFVNAHFDDRLQFKFGRMLTPFLYEYYGFSPAWEPVITNSPLFQIAGKRQVGAMAFGTLFENKVQYQAGIFNGVSGAFFDLDRNKDLIAALDVTPFAGSDTILDSLGGGFGIQTGWQNYLLAQGANSAAFINGAGEPSTNSAYINSTGVPFFIYNDNVRAAGNRTRLAPHVYWFGRFSVLAEYEIQARELADPVTHGFSTQRGYYVNVSYFLTGERYYGNGLGGYTTISPICPFRPSKCEWGPGAWELAAQFSELNVGNGDFARGFAAPGSTNRLDQLMVGVNWWPNKWIRVSFDWVWDKTNNPIPIAGGNPVDQYNIFWTRMAAFF